jgi:transposase
LRHVFANGGYAGNKIRTSVTKHGKWTIETIKRSNRAKGFEILLRRWVVERTFAWLGPNRCVAKHCERTIESAITWLRLASIQLTARRLASA